MNVYSISEAGGHPENEDAYLVERHPRDRDPGGDAEHDQAPATRHR